MSGVASDQDADSPREAPLSGSSAGSGKMGRGLRRERNRSPWGGA